jgi:hypothetical protein
MRSRRTCPKFDGLDQLIKHTAHVREARAEPEKREAAILPETAAVVDSAIGAAYSMPDTAEFVGLTPGRIPHITTAKNKSKPAASTPEWLIRGHPVRPACHRPP